jgi:hypothetical protein
MECSIRVGLADLHLTQGAAMNDADASPGHAAPTSSHPANIAPAQERLPKLSGDQLFKLADMIGAGTTAFPADLDPDDGECLVVEVRKRLRRRLVVLIGRAIADQVARDAAGEKEIHT